jgi:3-hydroxybutyryl-CoA dehydrogenase
VIEAVVEKLEVKQALFAELERIVGEEAVLASNTSSLSLAAIGRTCARRGRVCGLHFFNPVPLMRLVEVIPGPFTTADVTAAMVALVRRMGKTPVVAKDEPGFLVNLGGRAYYTEALHIEQEGVASLEQIDRIMRASAGFRMGPFELMDLTGIDVNFPVTRSIHEGHQYDPRLKTTPKHERMFEAGRFGRKVGLGFYDYPGKPSPTVEEAPRAMATELRAVVPEAHPGFAALAEFGLVEGVGPDAPILVGPFGEDATTAAHRLSLDPRRVVAVDFTGLERRVLTLMTPPVPSVALGPVGAWLREQGFTVEVIKDSPGFVAQRMLAMIVNLGCEMAQTRVGSPEDIETAMQLGLNYPFGPLEFGDRMGGATALETLQNLQAVTGSDRYRPSLWLRRRALLGGSLRATEV